MYFLRRRRPVFFCLYILLKKSLVIANPVTVSISSPFSDRHCFPNESFAFLIVPEKPMSIQKHSESEVCKAGAAREERVA